MNGRLRQTILFLDFSTIPVNDDNDEKYNKYSLKFVKEGGIVTLYN